MHGTLHHDLRNRIYTLHLTLMENTQMSGIFGLVILLAAMTACGDMTPISNTATNSSDSTTRASLSTARMEGYQAIVISSNRLRAEGALIDLQSHNPLTSLHLDDSGGTATSYQLFDSDGSLLDDKALRSESTIIDCSRLAKGKYRMHVTSAQEATLVVFEILVTPI